MKFKISISIIKNDLGVSKKQLCKMINSVHSDNYTYSLISFQIDNIHILGIIANDYFEKYEFNQNTIKEELLKALPNITNTPYFKLEDGTVVDIYTFNTQSSRLIIGDSRIENAEADIPF